MQHPHDIALAVALATGLAAAITDLWKFRIYNVLTLPLLATGLAYHTLSGGLEGLGQSLCGALVGFVPLFLLYLLGGMGAGDVKLMAGLGAWLAMPAIGHVLLATCLAAGIYALVLVAWTGRWRATWADVQLALFRLRTCEVTPAKAAGLPVRRVRNRRETIPFGALAALGVMIQCFCF
jgi:prepilin peptidase CpaA